MDRVSTKRGSPLRDYPTRWQSMLLWLHVARRGQLLEKQPSPLLIEPICSRSINAIFLTPTVAHTMALAPP